ncbi:MAG: uracil-DNA glycosylase [Elusimicrobiota bacterium]|nr:uracil-DNA glycosylase [Elusimicrobiota bacterium]
MPKYKLKKILRQMRDTGIKDVPASYLSLIAPPEKIKVKGAGKNERANDLNTLEALKELRAACESCRECPLGNSRLNPVFGEGSAAAKLMFVGEGPGFTEDHTGRPFIGRSGNLLTKIITDGMKLKREDVYISNIVKCHPMKDPSNPEKHGNDRPPSPDEVKKCMPILQRQIALIRPAVICTLGSPAAKIMLNTSSGISSIRGKIFNVCPLPDEPDYSVKLVPTFHPAYLLRNPPAKKFAWEDIKVVMRLLGQ